MFITINFHRYSSPTKIYYRYTTKAICLIPVYLHCRPRSRSGHEKHMWAKLSLRGYHIYREQWEVAIGEELQCQRDRGNAAMLMPYLWWEKDQSLATYLEGFHAYLHYLLGQAWASPTLAWLHCAHMCVSDFIAHTCVYLCLDRPLTGNFK